ncbi:MAG: exo-alpha-sialidase [Gammaproteobacteria bacterium]|nr:exo-alpha-sialidase [Gammaproteobacteria bacterium]
MLERLERYLALCTLTLVAACQNQSATPHPSAGNVGVAPFLNVALPGPGSASPGIAVDPNDARYVYVVSPHTPVENGDSVPTLWQSQDGGRSFTALRDFDAMPPGSSDDTDVIVAPDDGSVFVVNSNQNAGASNHVFTSIDHGGVYDGPAWAGAPSFRPWLAAAGDGVVYLAYINPPGGAGPGLWFMRSTDNGESFLPLSNVLAADPEGARRCFNVPARPLPDPRDAQTLYLAYAAVPVADCAGLLPRIAGSGGLDDIDDIAFEIWLARSNDGGASWSLVPVVPPERNGHFFIADAIDAAGTIYIVYSHADAGNETHILMRRSADGGRTWQGPFAVDQVAGNRANVLPAAAAAEAGRLDVAWYTAATDDFTDPAAQWTVVLARSRDAAGATPHFEQAQVSRSIVHEGEACQLTLICLLLGRDYSLGDFLSIAIGPDGRANVTWADDRAGAPVNYFGREGGA